MLFLHGVARKINVARMDNIILFGNTYVKHYLSSVDKTQKRRFQRKLASRKYLILFVDVRFTRGSFGGGFECAGGAQVRRMRINLHRKVLFTRLWRVSAFGGLRLEIVEPFPPLALL